MVPPQKAFFAGQLRLTKNEFTTLGLLKWCILGVASVDIKYASQCPSVFMSLECFRLKYFRKLKISNSDIRISFDLDLVRFVILNIARNESSWMTHFTYSAFEKSCNKMCPINSSITHQLFAIQVWQLHMAYSDPCSLKYIKRRCNYRTISRYGERRCIIISVQFDTDAMKFIPQTGR